DGLHAAVDGTFSALRGYPHDVLGGVLDVAGFAVHAVLRVDLQAVFAVVVLDELIHAGRAIARLGAAILGQVDRYRHGGVFQRQVDGFVFIVVGVGDEHRTELVERQLAIGLGIIDARA